MFKVLNINQNEISNSVSDRVKFDNIDKILHQQTNVWSSILLQIWRCQCWDN